MRLNDTSSITLKIDLASWMTQSGRFSDIHDTGRDWIAATCPFHDDRHPSFAVNVDTGVYACQACGARGGFTNLVKHVEGHATAYDAELSLIVRFGNFVPATDEPLNLDFGDAEEETFVSEEAIKPMVCEYFRGRGLTFDTMGAFMLGYSAKSDAVKLPWFDAKHRLITIKYRSIVDKRFWYEPRITPGRLRRMLYGLHVGTTQRAPMLVVCEGEIDAMSVVQSGFAAVALGGSSLSKAQASLIRNHACSEVVVFTDNDEAGRKARAAIVDALVGTKRVSVVDWSLWTYEAKDANDLLVHNGEAAIRHVMRDRIPIGLSLKFE